MFIYTGWHTVMLNIRYALITLVLFQTSCLFYFLIFLLYSKKNLMPKNICNYIKSRGKTTIQE